MLSAGGDDAVDARWDDIGLQQWPRTFGYDVTLRTDELELCVCRLNAKRDTLAERLHLQRSPSLGAHDNAVLQDSESRCLRADRDGIAHPSVGQHDATRAEQLIAAIEGRMGWLDDQLEAQGGWFQAPALRRIRRCRAGDDVALQGLEAGSLHADPPHSRCHVLQPHRALAFKAERPVDEHPQRHIGGVDLDHQRDTTLGGTIQGQPPHHARATEHHEEGCGPEPPTAPAAGSLRARRRDLRRRGRDRRGSGRYASRAA